MYKIIVIIIYTVIVGFIYTGFLYMQNKNLELEKEVKSKKEQQENLRSKIDNILKGQEVKKLNTSYNKLKEYFTDRSQLTKLELLYFLEFVYPSDSFVESLNISQGGGDGKKIDLNFYSNNLEGIRKMARNLEFLQKEGIISEYALKPVKKEKEITVEQGQQETLLYYSLSFNLTPNYSLVREFVLKRNDDLKIPFEEYLILLPEDINKALGTGEQETLDNGNN